MARSLHLPFVIALCERNNERQNGCIICCSLFGLRANNEQRPGRSAALRISALGNRESPVI
jgi:hypothetical protein